jgi:hypothetical protein
MSREHQEDAPDADRTQQVREDQEHADGFGE